MRTATRQTLLNLVVPAYLAACILLGGASAAGFLANMVLQLAALPILWFALLVHRDTPITRAGRSLLWLLVLLLGVFALQLLPLPPAVWRTLPQRELVARGFAMLGEPLPWLPLSLAPRRTLASLLWLLPAAAVLLGILRLGAFRLGWLAWVIAGLAMVSTLLGAIQLLDGDNSAAYFYRITNYGVAVGLFANANHFATLLLIAAPFVTALIAQSRAKRHRRQASALTIALSAVLLVVLVGLALSGSLAGVGIAVPVAGACLLILRGEGAPVPRWAMAGLAAAALGSVAIVMSQPFDNNLTSATARDDSLSRYTSFTTTWRAARDYLPAGSGIGTFLPIYRQYENPRTTISTYVNHAHSDPIEIALEAGLPGIALMLLVLAWWVRRSFAIWSDAQSGPFLRAATIASGAVIAHSSVDYPLRTAAISALFAMCLAIMTDPRERTLGRRKQEEPAARHVVA